MSRPWQLELPHGFQRWQTLTQIHARPGELAEEWRGQQQFEAWLIATGKGEDLRAYCACCSGESAFAISNGSDGVPSWRETLACRTCGLINRLRASLHLYRVFAPSLPAGRVYLTEQTTSLYHWLAARVPDLIGSEFVAAGLVSGTEVERAGARLRHEDVTALSMPDASLSAVLTFDVLEHVPNYAAAIAEFSRVLAPGGLLLLTAPFYFQLQDTSIRARVLADGSIEHLLPPDYHGDPLSENGVLCYQYFGWDLLDLIRASGFAHVELITTWAPEFAYLSSFQPFIVAWR